MKPVHRSSQRGVAQSGSAPALGAGSRRFKSSRPDQFLSFILVGCEIVGCQLEYKSAF